MENTAQSVWFPFTFPKQKALPRSWRNCYARGTLLAAEPKQSERQSQHSIDTLKHSPTN